MDWLWTAKSATTKGLCYTVVGYSRYVYDGKNFSIFIILTLSYMNTGKS